MRPAIKAKPTVGTVIKSDIFGSLMEPLYGKASIMSIMSQKEGEVQKERKRRGREIK